jgi:predicted short-subunit dehydrogenase-like oxidoreductase (DUF2520 family)
MQGSPALGDLTFSLVGAGRVGASLACWLVAAGARAVAIGHRVERPPAPAGGRAAALAAALGARAVPLPDLASSGTGLLLVAVADPALDAVAAELAARPQAAVALHTSGSRDAAALAPLAGAGSAVGGFHPLMAFAREVPDPEAARGVFFALDGDPRALALGRRIAAAWGATAAVVPPASRDLYHLAASLAAGGVTTLLAVVEALGRELELPPEALAGYRELARGAIAAIDPSPAGSPDCEWGGAAAAITGPVVRGDADTVLRQLGALGRSHPELVPLVALLGREALGRSARGRPLDGAHRDLDRALAEALVNALSERGFS